MKCRQAFELDLADFVVDEGSDRWVAFRAHYPTCADCAAEVAAWTEVETLLRSGGLDANPEHPSKELLLRYEEEPEVLSATETAMLERHLASCRACPDELAALRTFDFSRIVRRPAPPPLRSWRTAALEAAARIRTVLLHPAFAYALVVLLLYPALIRPSLVARSLPMEQVALESHRPPEAAPSTVDRTLTERAASDTAQTAKREVDAVAAAPRPRQTAARTAVDAGNARAREERAKPAPPERIERAVARAPAATEPGLPPGNAEASHETQTGEDLDALAHDDLDDPDGDAPRVLGLAEVEEPRAPRPSPEDAAAWQPVVLAPGQSPLVERAALASGIVLRLPPSIGREDARVVGPNGRDVASELRHPTSPGPVEVRIRADQLVAGTYHVQSRASNAASLVFLVR